jgi:hypothetical protein
MPARKKTDLVQCGLRLREGLRQRVEVEARKNRVPLNAEISRRLQESFSLRTLEDIAADMSRTLERARKAG